MLAIKNSYFVATKFNITGLIVKYSPINLPGENFIDTIYTDLDDSGEAKDKDMRGKYFVS
jgi:hypothetical protein